MDAALGLPPVYPISPERLGAGELLVWARALLEAGCRFFQYRRKGGTDTSRVAELTALVALSSSFGARVIVDDRPDLCLICDAAGVHLGQEDLPAPEAKRLLPGGKIVGYSTHDMEQFREALETPADYLALGPVFGTTSKERPDPVVSVHDQEEALRLASLPVVAIGGITPERARALWSRGFASVAVIGALETDPARGWEAFLEARRDLEGR